MNCEKCGALIVLKATSFSNNVHFRYWECPVCGWEHVDHHDEGVVLK